MKEERKNTRTAILYIILTTASLVFLFFVGIPILGKFTAFISDLGRGNKPITNSDKTPPAPPKFNTFPDFTNQNQINLSGFAEPGATVKLIFRGESFENIADRSGGFVFNTNLSNGENIFSATAIDQAGNTSQKTQDLKIVFDNKPPDLTINSPQDNSQFFGSRQRQVTIQGTTEPNTQVTANDRIIAVDNDGKFQYTTTLIEGENKFTLKSIDLAGNTIEKDLTLTFSE